MNTKDIQNQPNQLNQPNSNPSSPAGAAELARREAEARVGVRDLTAEEARFSARDATSASPRNLRAKCTIEAVTPTPANQSPQGVTITLKAVSDADNSEFFAENPNGRFVAGNSVYVDFTPAR